MPRFTAWIARETPFPAIRRPLFPNWEVDRNLKTKHKPDWLFFLLIYLLRIPLYYQLGTLIMSVDDTVVSIMITIPFIAGELPRVDNLQL